ncbi:MAG: type I phosphomannose isomerase catalytic subunit [Christensenellaceae bacterium]|nr:type I phosphomannose isomerase catalytic subunit [Christensenellaceae bacterium]
MLYPLKLSPYFRHGVQTPWGGRKLADLFGKAIPDDRTGESLEISALPGMQSRIENGELNGRPLGAAVEIWGEALTGLKEPGFPLLVKLIDARERLSVQVHPGDGYAGSREGKRGKTEAWVVLAAPCGAQLVYGVEAGGRALKDIVAEGRLESALNWVDVQPGDVLYIPHGMVHAIGGELLMYEIQQSSDVTYRFWDWGRVDEAGRGRALHTEQALDVTRPELKLPKIAGATLLVRGGSATYYISNKYFELKRLNVADDMPLDGGRMLLITALGPCALTWPGGGMALEAGGSALVPAALEGAVLKGRVSALCATMPDREALKRSLGYRAGAVAGLLEE